MTESSQLLTKVLEIVEVMGEMRQQLSSFIEKCGDKDLDNLKYINDLQKRMALIESEGTKIVRELLKEEASKLQLNIIAVNKLSDDVKGIKDEITNLKADKKIINWKVGVVISFVSIVVTLILTYILNHILTLWMA